jgi:hypothetical protein
MILKKIIAKKINIMLELKDKKLASIKFFFFNI